MIKIIFERRSLWGAKCFFCGKDSSGFAICEACDKRMRMNREHIEIEKRKKRMKQFSKKHYYAGRSL